MGGNVGFRPPKNATLIYSPRKGRGGGQLIGYSQPSPYGTATYDLNGKPTNKVADKVVLEYRKTHPGGGGGIFGALINAVNTNISTPLTQALQPVEKVANAVASDPKALVAIAAAVAAPYAAASLAPYLTAFGSYAGVAAQAITSITVQVAQGVPIEKATENALVNVATSGVSSAIAKQIGTVVTNPNVANAISSTVTSGLATAAKGGSQADVEKAMTAGLVSSAASTAYKEAIDSSSTIASAAVGGAAGGAVTGGTEGAVTGGLSSAAGALGSNLAKPTPKPADTAALPPSEVAALGGAVSPDTTSQSDVDTSQTSIEIAPAPVAGLDLTKEQTPAPVTEPKQGAYLPSTTPTAADQKILDLIATPSNVAPTVDTATVTTPPVVEPKQGEYLPEAAPAPAPVTAPTTDQQILDLIAEKPATTDVAAVGDEPATPDKTPVTELPVETPVTTVEPPVEVDTTGIPRVEVSGVGTVPIEPTPVAEGYSTSMPDESAAETARLAAKEQQILDLITPAPVATEPKQGAYLPDTAPAPETPDVPAVEVAPSTGTGLIDTPPVSDTDKQILDLISEKPTEDQSDAETERLARKEAELAGAEKGAYLPDSGTDTTTTSYKPNIFTTTYLSPKTRTAAAPTSALGSALGTTGLTSYRGAGEIEAPSTGKARKKVWNEKSLKLKDALGV